MHVGSCDLLALCAARLAVGCAKEPGSLGGGLLTERMDKGHD